MERFEAQPVFTADENGTLQLIEGSFVQKSLTWRALLEQLGITKPLVVSGSHFDDYRAKRELDNNDIAYTLFCGYSANPTYEQAYDGLLAFRKQGCDGLVSVGGGSAMDTAKCIKQLAALPNADVPECLSTTPLPESTIPHLAVPTTAGTGSESTHFAVIYIDGVKTSVTHAALHPDAAVLDSAALAGLPDYQKKATVLDALCQAIESYWSVRSSKESRAYSAAAISVLVQQTQRYLAGNNAAASLVLRAANKAGKAINLTTTTAPHAMSYKLTSLYGIPHGHAVALCMPYAWRILAERGDATTKQRLSEIAQLIGDGDGLDAFERFYAELEIHATIDANANDAALLAASVNPERLSNFPVKVSAQELTEIYQEIIS